MARTVLKTLLIIVILSGLIFTGLWIWESQRAKTSAPTVAPETLPQSTPQQVAAVSISQITVEPNASGVTLIVKEVPGSNYRISSEGVTDGFVIRVPGAELNLAKSTMLDPHPQISKISTSETDVQGSKIAMVQVQTKGSVTTTDRLIGSSLYIDVTFTDSAPVASVIEKKPTAPAEKKPKPKTTAKKKASKKMVVRKSTPKPKPTSTPAPTPMPELDEILAEEDVPDVEPLDIPELDPKDVAEIQPPLEPPADLPVDDEIDLDTLFEDTAPAEAPIAENIPDNEVAVVPPSSGSWGEGSILPKVSDISVRTEGSWTTIAIAREASSAFKVFGMRNPARVVVDFQNLANGLKPSYPSFQGTRVTKVTTEQFSGPSGTMSRVTLFLNGSDPAKIERSTQGTSLILKIPN